MAMITADPDCKGCGGYGTGTDGTGPCPQCHQRPPPKKPVLPHVRTVRDRIFDLISAFETENIEPVAVVLSLHMVERLYVELWKRGLSTPGVDADEMRLHTPRGSVLVLVDPYAADDFVRVLPPFTRAHQARDRIKQ